MVTDAENINGMNQSSAERLTHAIYGLQLATLITIITLFVAIIINYVKREDVAGTPLEAHFNWQIRTFWVLVLINVIGILIFLTGSIIATLLGDGDIEAGILGFPFLFIVLALPLMGLVSVIYLIYRVAKGWIRLNEGRQPSD